MWGKSVVLKQTNRQTNKQTKNKQQQQQQAHLVFCVDGTLFHHKLDHLVATLQGEVVMVSHGDDHLTKDATHRQLQWEKRQQHLEKWQPLSLS